jgi:magnesium chelatase, subunit chII family protein
MEYSHFKEHTDRVVESCSRVIVGKEETVRLIFISFLCSGHVLLEDVPGTGKTMLLKAFARTVGSGFKRIQFTPDLLPSDLTGINFYNQKTGEFQFREGPLFTNIVLADEINRATPRTQSSLLEAMEESQITVDGVTRPLSAPFFVIATQNPIETLGTYPLPEAQLDRFLMRISMASPTKEQERAILQRFMKEEPLETLQSVCTREDILALQKQAKEIYIHPVLLDYMIDLVQATRSWPNIDMGVSPRGSLALVRAVRAYALVRGGAYVVPEDIKTVAVPVLAHRLQLSGSVGSTDAQKKAMTDVLSSVALPTEDWSK